MTIREVSAMTGMREDTLRYYEQIGVIPQVPRNKWGVRTYQEPVLQKIFLVQKLKAAGMPLKGIKQYMEACSSACSRPSSCWTRWEWSNRKPNRERKDFMMRRWMAAALAALMVLSLAACAGSQQEEQPASAEATEQSQSASVQEEEEPASLEEPASTEQQSEEPSNAQESGVLVAYFSWADNAVIDGEVDAVASPSVTAPGNVQQLAQWISERTGGDLFSIQVTEPYSSDWDACLERANQERAEDARPELTASVEQLERYDTVFLGYPNWWYGVPMALLSFLEENDLSDKQVYLFCSHGTGGLASSVEQIDEALPDSTALSKNVFDVYEEDASSSQQDILAWLEELGY